MMASNPDAMTEDERYRKAVDAKSRRFIIANARAMQASKQRRVPNWSFVGQLFGLGSGFSWRLCVEEGIDPDGYTVAHFAPREAAE
jgi:hypothetical protein